MRPQRAVPLVLLLAVACSSKPYDAEADGLDKRAAALDRHAADAEPQSVTSRVDGRTLTVNYFVSAPLGPDRSGRVPDYVCTAALGTDRAGTRVLVLRP